MKRRQNSRRLGWSYLLELRRFFRAGIWTYEGSLVGHGRQDVVQDEQQHGDGQQHGDFEAQLLPTMVRDEEGGQIQAQEEQDGQQEVDDVEEWPPLHGELGRGKGSKVNLE